MKEMKLLSRIAQYIWIFNQKGFINKLRKRNLNHDFTLISNNCIGGIVYHNLGEQFRSPTINLYIQGEEYLEFVKNLKYYLEKCELIECNNSDKNFPVGILQSEDGYRTIHIYFQHYKTFQEAKEKWDERSKRVNYQNIFYIWEFYDDVYDSELIKAFDLLPIKKMCLLHREFPEIKNKVIFSCYTNGKPMGRIFARDGIFGRRYLDKFDYVKFLND